MILWDTSYSRSNSIPRIVIKRSAADKISQAKHWHERRPEYTGNGGMNGTKVKHSGVRKFIMTEKAIRDEVPLLTSLRTDKGFDHLQFQTLYAPIKGKSAISGMAYLTLTRSDSVVWKEREKIVIDTLCWVAWFIYPLTSQIFILYTQIPCMYVATWKANLTCKRTYNRNIVMLLIQVTSTRILLTIYINQTQNLPFKV